MFYRSCMRHSSCFPAPTNSAYSELTALIDSTNSPDSPFHISQATTDAKVYPFPNTTEPNGPSKRKRTEDGHISSPPTNDIGNARYSELVHANKHLLKLSETTKAECAQLSDSCVRDNCLYCSPPVLQFSHPGQSQVMD